MTEGSSMRKRIHFQVAEVHKALLSTAKAADMGYDSYYGKKGGYLEDTQTGERIPLHRRGDLYVLRMWIKAAPRRDGGMEESRAEPTFGRQR